MNLRISQHRVKPPAKEIAPTAPPPRTRFLRSPASYYNLSQSAPGEVEKMRRLFSLAAFGFGFYYLWNNNDFTIECVAVGAMGLALLLEFLGAD